VLIVAFVGVYLYYVNMEKPKEELPPVVTINNDSVVGCYVAKLAKDVYLLKIDSEVNGNVVGALAFNNFEKDSSSGTFNGTYKDGILLGNYSFSSEGMDSEMQVIFKKEEGAFVRGYGNTKIEGDKVTFENLADITYDSSAKFTKNPTCMETFTKQITSSPSLTTPCLKLMNQTRNKMCPTWSGDSMQNKKECFWLEFRYQKSTCRIQIFQTHT